MNFAVSTILTYFHRVLVPHVVVLSDSKVEFFAFSITKVAGISPQHLHSNIPVEYAGVIARVCWKGAKYCSWCKWLFGIKMDWHCRLYSKRNFKEQSMYFVLSTWVMIIQWFYGVMVSTMDFESIDPGSNPGRTYFFKTQPIFIELRLVPFLK